MAGHIITRADTLTATLKQQEYYSDFLDSFATTPVGGELGRIKNERSVTQSIINLIFTNLGERLFQPLIGSSIFSDLFEINDTITLSSIELNVNNTIKYYEPRASVISVIATEGDDHTVNVEIVYYLINNPDPININFLLKRVR